MQTFTFDISVRGVTPVLNVKQGDVGRKFKAVITDCGAAYSIPSDAQLSVWYSGPSGQGNYSVIGVNSAFSVSGSTVTVELIAQMLTNHGQGAMCLVLNSADGSQIGLWNVIYVVEAVPGMNSQTAEDYYTALSELAQKAIEAAATFETDPTLTVSGKAADAAQVGTALAGKAPAGYGLGELTGGACADCNTAVRNGWYNLSASTANPPIVNGTTHTVGTIMVIGRSSRIWQLLYAYTDLKEAIAIRHSFDSGATWSAWVDCAPSAFAPAGYGLGEVLGKYCSDLNTATVNGWYWFNAETDNLPSDISAYGTMLVRKRLSTEIVQEIRSVDGKGISVIRESRDNGATWVLEYVNPPMTVGVEYRTTERWNGNAVYCMMVDFGSLPATTYKAVSIPTTIAKCLRYSLVNKYSSAILTGHRRLDVDASGSTLQINATTDMSNYQAWCCLWYTKG